MAYKNLNKKSQELGRTTILQFIIYLALFLVVASFIYYYMWPFTKSYIDRIFG